MKTKTKTTTLFNIATQARDDNGAVAFTHHFVDEDHYHKNTDYLIGSLFVAPGSRGTKLELKPVVVIDGDYDFGGRLEIPAETKAKINADGSVEFKFGGRTHMLTFYQKTPMLIG